ncbi:MAG: hypothetical protein M3Y08_18535 [Fibrobacterota bacterium]|nr:hypothetical protein [Fibrobacterota bacterium]
MNPPAKSARFRLRIHRTLGIGLGFCIALILSGCSVIGGVIGHRKDVHESTTRIVPSAEAATIRKGAMVYLTIQNSQTMKGRFHFLSAENGKPAIHLRTADGESRIGLGDVSEIAEDLMDHDKRIKGLLIGAAVDAIILVGGFWIFNESQNRSID